MPLSLQYGFDVVKSFLEVCCLALSPCSACVTGYRAYQGARSMDQHFINAPHEKVGPLACEAL